MVEHDLCKVGVWGSNPHASTTTEQARRYGFFDDLPLHPGFPGFVDKARIVELDTNDVIKQLR